MSEVAMSPHAAVAEIQRLENLRGPLERRTAGVTAMVWGVVSAAIFVSYSYVGLVGAMFASEMFWLMPFLWMPWVAFGVFITISLWRSVGLVVPSLGDWRDGVKVMAVFILLTSGGGYLMYLFDLPIVEPGVILAMVALANLFMAASGLATADKLDRRLHAVSGIFLLLVVAVTSVVVTDRDMAYAWYSLIAPASVLLAFFGSGAYLVTRG